MISVFAPLETTFTGNGEAVLTPLSGSVRQAAGGEYSFTMEHPLDPWGKWKHLKREAIVRLPVPKEVIENSYTGIEADIYKTNTDAPLRSGTTEPSTITYSAWSQYSTYSVGSKVTSGEKNYECIYWDGASTYRAQAPGASTWWKEIARSTPGDPVLVNLKSGTELYLDSTFTDTNWYRMTTTYGVIGYIKKTQVTFDHHSSATENKPRTITEQLFRIKEVNVNRDQGTVSVSGVHVSYDLNGNIVEDMELYDVSVAMAISRISNGLQLSYPGMISTNMTSSSLGKFTGKFKRKNGMFCLADPDTGIVKHYEAKFTRDNWDLFVMTNTETDRGYTIRYAKNVNGINWKEKTDKLITRVMPVAKAEDGTDLYLPEKWVSSSHVSDYPVIYMETLNVTGQVGKDDGTGTDTVWTEANLLTEMRTKAGERFSVNKIDLPVVEVTVQLEALENTEEYKWLKDLLQVQLYDKVTVTDPDIGNSQSLTVEEIEYDIVKKKITGVKLSSGTGDVSRTVTGYDIKNGSVTSSKLSGEVYDSLMSDMKGLIPDFADPFVETSHMNTKDQDGIVTKGSGNASKVWATDENGNPAWRVTQFTLPLAADGVRGGIQIGFTPRGKNYPVQLENEKAYVYVPWEDTIYELPLAADGVRGGIQTGYTQNGKNYPVQLSNEKAFVNVPWSDTVYTLPTASSSTKGGIKTGYTASGQNYPVQMSGENAYVNVPWSDTKYSRLNPVSLGTFTIPRNTYSRFTCSVSIASYYELTFIPSVAGWLRNSITVPVSFLTGSSPNICLYTKSSGQDIYFNIKRVSNTQFDIMYESSSSALSSVQVSVIAHSVV